MRDRPPQKKTYRPPKVRSERAAPPEMFASGLIREPDEPTAEPSPQH